ELFIRQQRESTGMRLRELKQTAAPDWLSANRAFEADVWSIVEDMVEQFKNQMKPSQPNVQQIDSVAELKKLRSACGGKVDETEEKLRPLLKATMIRGSSPPITAHSPVDDQKAVKPE